MIYLVGGVPGMRKSTIISPCFLAKKSVDHHNSTDLIRASTSEVLRFVGKDPKELVIKEISELRTGEDTGAWIGTMNLINLLNIKQKDALIEGLAITPTGVADLESQFKNLKVRAAFIGFSKIMKFQPPGWTPELEKLIEDNFGKNHLASFKSRDWAYNEMRPYGQDELDESRRIEIAADKLSKTGHTNLQYFDLSRYIPSERLGGDLPSLHLEDHIRAAVDIRNFLLG